MRIVVCYTYLLKTSLLSFFVFFHFPSPQGKWFQVIGLITFPVFISIYKHNMSIAMWQKSVFEALWKSVKDHNIDCDSRFPQYLHFVYCNLQLYNNQVHGICSTTEKSNIISHHCELCITCHTVIFTLMWNMQHYRKCSSGHQFSHWQYMWIWIHYSLKLLTCENLFILTTYKII